MVLAIICLIAFIQIIDGQDTTEDAIAELKETDQLLISTVLRLKYKLSKLNRNPEILKPKSCQEIYKSDNRNPSGEYVIYQEKHAIKVYCSFEGKYGYTFISRKSSGREIDVQLLYTTKDFAKICVLKSNNEQREVIVENLSSYQKSTTLTLDYNSHSDYQGPYYTNKSLHPYLFLGFLPIKLSRNRNIQGYRASGKDFKFRNCDADPNSYITFFFNPNHNHPKRYGGPNNFMTGWMDKSHKMEYPKYMDDSFYMDWEMHMGGCGGFLTSWKTSNTKAALGLPFAIRPCDGVVCRNGGRCIVSKSVGVCRCKSNFRGRRCEH